MQGAIKQQRLQWGDSVQLINISGYERKPLPGKDQAWKHDQVKCLPTIGRLAKEGIFSVYTYFELQSEGWKRSDSFPAKNIGNIFSGVTLNHANAAVERSYFFQMELDKYIQTREVIDYCKWLLTPGIEELADKLSGDIRYPDHLLNNLKGAQRFRDLCNGLAEKQYPDAFHLWTAEVNGADYFLTIDGKFIRAMVQTKHIRLPCKPISPSELLTLLEINERDQFEYREGQFYDIFGRPS